jgi:hypothetical protein
MNETRSMCSARRAAYVVDLQYLTKLLDYGTVSALRRAR